MDTSWEVRAETIRLAKNGSRWRWNFSTVRGCCVGLWSGSWAEIMDTYLCEGWRVNEYCSDADEEQGICRTRKGTCASVTFKNDLHFVVGRQFRTKTIPAPNFSHKTVSTWTCNFCTPPRENKRNRVHNVNAVDYDMIILCGQATHCGTDRSAGCGWCKRKQYLILLFVSSQT